MRDDLDDVMIAEDGEGAGSERGADPPDVRQAGAEVTGRMVGKVAGDDGEIMGVRHRTLPVQGVQFHPESILTECGHSLLANFLKTTA